MSRKLIDYVRAETKCNYSDIVDYFSEINNLGCETLKAACLSELFWFIANTEDLDDSEFMELGEG